RFTSCTSNHGSSQRTFSACTRRQPPDRADSSEIPWQSGGACAHPWPSPIAPSAITCAARVPNGARNTTADRPAPLAEERSGSGERRKACDALIWLVREKDLEQSVVTLDHRSGFARPDIERLFRQRSGAIPPAAAERGEECGGVGEACGARLH